MFMAKALKRRRTSAFELTNWSEDMFYEFCGAAEIRRSLNLSLKIYIFKFLGCAEK